MADDRADKLVHNRRLPFAADREAPAFLCEACVAPGRWRARNRALSARAYLNPVIPSELRRENVKKIAGECFLTVREVDVLHLAKGYNQRGIAGKLDVSDNTVRTHMRNLYRKLQIHSRQDAIELVEGFGRGEGAKDLS